MDLQQLIAISVHAGCLDFLLRPQQREIKEWILDAWTKLEIVIVHASRGYGKTYLALCMAIELGMRKPRSRIIYACPTREEAKKVMIPTMQMIMEEIGEIIGINRGFSDNVYKLPNGTVILIEGADDDKGNHLRGPWADYVICDEAGFWRHFTYVLRSVLYPQVHRCGGKMIVISTSPESVGHEFVGECGEAKQNGGYLQRTIDDNEHLSQDEKDKLIKELGGAKSTAARRELWCEFVTDTQRAVIPEFNKERHVFDDFEQIPVWRDRYVFIDLGFNDFTHVLFGFWHFTEACLYIEDESAQTRALTTDTAEVIKDKEKILWGEHKPHRRIADNDLQIIADLAKAGVNVFPTMKNDKEAQINSLRTMFQADKIKIHKRCVNLIHQLEVGIWNTSRTDYERLPGAGHLDGIDALVYGNRMLDRNHNPVPENYGYSSVTHFIPPSQAKNKQKKLLAIVGKR